jgi:putative DNA primase/helicase
MVDGCLEWQRDGLMPPPAVLDATDRYLAEEDAIGRWFADYCACDVNAWTSSKELFASWKAWAEANGERIGSSKAFSQAIEDMQIGLTRGRDGTGNKGWRGVRLANYAAGDSLL